MVNIKDFESLKYTGDGDRLEDIFAHQRELMKKYAKIEGDILPCIVPVDVPVMIDSRYGQHQIKERIFCTIIELAEASDCMKNKAWKQSMVETDVDHLKEELADALHFFVETCILVGIDAEELHSLYLRKAEVNKFRQRSNY